MSQSTLTSNESNPVDSATRELETAAADEHQPSARLRARSFGLSDRGKVRETNEDQFLIAELFKALRIQVTSLPHRQFKRSDDASQLFIVADGMGGRPGGEAASALAIDSVESFVLESLKWFATCKGDDQDQVLADFKRSLSEASNRVQIEGNSNPDLEGMGTTLTLAYRLNHLLYVAHAGDSRCYLSRSGSLMRLTRDHTFVDQLVRGGHLTAEKARHHKLRHVITNALGGGCPETEVEVHKLHLEPGDILMLCSDGLSEMLTDDRISEILESADGPEQACRQLVDSANAAGGKDNVTVIVVYFDEAKFEVLS